MGMAWGRMKSAGFDVANQDHSITVITKSIHREKIIQSTDHSYIVIEHLLRHGFWYRLWFSL